MPNFLSSLWQGANQSIVPEAPVRKLQEAMTEPHLDENPWWARAKGFGAGALEGLRNQLTPMNIAATAAGPIARGFAGAAGAVEGAEGLNAARKAVAPTMDLIESSPWQSAKQIAPAADDVDALLGGLRSTLAKTPKAGAMKGLQSAAPAAEFAPVGGEGAYNAARPAAAALPDPTEGVYQSMLKRLPTRPVHDSQAIADIQHPGAQEMMGKMYAESNPMFRQLQQAGAFNGQR